MGHLDWNKVRKLECQQKKTIEGNEFHVKKVLDRAVVVRPKGGKDHRVSRNCLEKAVQYINKGNVLRGPEDYRRKICDDKPSYAWAILRNLRFV